MKRPTTASSRLPLVAAMVVVLTTMGPSKQQAEGFAFAPTVSRHNNNRRRRRMATFMQANEQYSMMDRQHQQQQQQQHLVLIGGGHAHVQVIKALNARDRPSNLKVTLIDAQASASYSGMVPGCIANHYTPEETLLHLHPLATWAGMDFIHDRVVDIDFDQKLVYTRNAQEQPIAFDVISIDIGSTSRDLNVIPGAGKHTIPTRPIDKLINRLDRARLEWQEEQQEVMQQVASSSSSSSDDDDDYMKQRPRIVVVGGGAAGVELAMTIESRWHHLQPHITLLHGGNELMSSESKVARNKLKQILDSKNIIVHHDCTVKCVEEDCIELLEKTKTTGKTIVPFTHCIWATGAGAHHLAYHLHNVRGLDITKRGWIKVHDTLQSFSHPFVFAAGDCAEIQNLPQGPPAKAGVYAVRAGPILVENLTRYLHHHAAQRQQQPNHTTHDDSLPKMQEQAELIRYKPQDDFLKLIVCGHGEALGFRFGMAFFGKWVFQMKDQIDQSFMNLFRVEHLPQLETTTSSRNPIASTTATAVATRKNKYDIAQQYDAKQHQHDHHHHSRMDPQEAAELLQRSDDNVDYQTAWAVIRDMAGDDEYRERVLQHACGGAIRQPASIGSAAGLVEVGILQ